MVVDLSGIVPEGATAVAVNLTLSGVTQRTFASPCPASVGTSACATTSTVNAYPGRDIANLAFPQLGADRRLRIYNNVGSVLASLDVVGYFTTAAPSSDFTPVEPRRDDTVLTLDDAESGVVTIDAVPPGATAVAIRITVAGVDSNTYVSACPVAAPLATCTGTSSLNSRQRDVSNLAIVPIGADTGIRVYNNVGSVIVYADVTGFFTPAGTGSRYVSVPPTRVQGLDALETATGNGSVSRNFRVVPVEAVAVAANVTAAGNTATSFVSVCPGEQEFGACVATSTVNPYAGQDTASATLIATDQRESGLTYITNTGSTLLFTDLRGYFVR